MQNVFDITDFGAVGDGKTDCTYAVQSALDEASKCSGKVVVPPGKYMVGYLKVHGRGVSIVGTSAWSFKIHGDNSSIFVLNDNSVKCMLDITGAIGCNISGMCFYGNYLGENIHGIYSYWDTYNGGGEEDTPSIDNCRVGTFSGNGVHFEHIWCFSVRHSMLHRNKGSGLFVDGWDGFILDNWFSGNLGYGFSSGETLASITCTGNRVEWNRKGGFKFPFGDSYNITGNFFDRSFGPALFIGCDKERSGDIITITGNIFRRSGALEDGKTFEDKFLSSHVILKNLENTVMIGNTMRVGRNDGGSGILSPDYAIIVDNCKYSIVKDNTFERGALKELLVLRGDNSTCEISSNIGNLSSNDNKTSSSLLN